MKNRVQVGKRQLIIKQINKQLNSINNLKNKKMMTFCSKCGTQMADNVKFCPVCGNPAQAAASEQPAQPKQSAGDDFSNKFSNLNNTADTTAGFGKADIEQNKVMAILAYLGILVFVPIFAAKESPFARYHANQGLILCIAMIAWAVVDSILTAILRAILWSGLGLWSIYSLCGTVLNLVYIAFTILAIIGILNAVNGKAKELPFIGKYKLLK
jgi:uncharacterized membrane protein